MNRRFLYHCTTADLGPAFRSEHDYRVFAGYARDHGIGPTPEQYIYALADAELAKT